jgi:Peptidase family M50.
MFRRVLLSSEVAALFAMLLIIEDSRYPLLLFCAAAIHECGHITAARICGVGFRMRGAGFGGISIEFDCMNLSYQKEIFIALGGAILNLIAATICTILNKVHFHSPLVSFFVICNVTLALINLTPVKFFDGCTILKCILLILFDEPTATKIHSVVTILTSILLWLTAVYVQLVLGGNLSLLLISIYIMFKSLSPLR